MSDGFDWNTQDETWEEASPPAGARSAGPWRRWALLLALAVLSVAVLYFVWRQVQGRSDAAVAQLQTDVFSTLNLVNIAESNGDEELFTSLLSGRLPRWTQATYELFVFQLLFERPQFGLAQAGGAGIGPLAAEGSSATFSPNLTEAEVSTAQEFAIAAGNGVSETIALQRTEVLRLGRERWLLAPPLPEFWGEWDSISSGRLTVHFRERDAALARRLAADLEPIVPQVCQLLGDGACAADLRLDLRLSSDQESLLETTIPIDPTIVDSVLALELPTPTLVGTPLDESGYRALWRGYASLLAEGLVNAHLGWRCCDQVLLQRALLDKLLDELSLRPWPVNDAAYKRVVAENTQLADLGDVWFESRRRAMYGDDLWLAQIGVDFLQKTLPEVTTMQMLRLLQTEPGFQSWLLSLLAASGFDGDGGRGARALAELEALWRENARLAAAQ